MLDEKELDVIDGPNEFSQYIDTLELIAKSLTGKTHLFDKKQAKDFQSAVDLLTALKADVDNDWERKAA